MYHRRDTWIVLLVCSLLGAVVPAHAQLQNFSLPHLFALPTTTSTRLLGMGGFLSCINDAGFANPAFAGTLTHYAATGIMTTTDFAGGLDLVTNQASVAIPLQRGVQGLQLTGLNVRSSSAGVLHSPAGAVRDSITESDAAIHYGHSFGSHWAAGVGLSPVFGTNSDLSNPANGMMLAHLHSFPQIGCSLGGIYRMEGGCAGVIWDNWRENVSGAGLAFPQGSASGMFTSREAVAGVSHQLGDRVLAAVEWQELSTQGLGTTTSHTGWRGGVEVTPARDWSVRIGDNDNAFSTGLGLQAKAWAFEYAYVSNLNHQALKTVLGDSETNSLEVRYAW
jgi:hypothetical protein